MMKGCKRSMLEYCKFIMDKFSFSPRLFRKEYRKSLRFLSPEEHPEFRTWIRQRFNPWSERNNDGITGLQVNASMSENKINENA
jgi:hypothetical protein